MRFHLKSRVAVVGLVSAIKINRVQNILCVKIARANGLVHNLGLSNYSEFG